MLQPPLVLSWLPWLRICGFKGPVRKGPGQGRDAGEATYICASGVILKASISMTQNV